MRRQIGVGLAVGAGVLGFGLIVTWVMRGRAEQDRLYCANHLREIGQATLVDPASGPQWRPRGEIPAGTVFLTGVPPERRLSWFVPSLPGYPNRAVDVGELVKQFDLKRSADEEPNLSAGRTVIRSLFCPAVGPPSVPLDSPAPTMYVGSAGLGADAATLAAGDPRSGAFRYDGPTPYPAISDGLSGTLLFLESRPVGGWSVGGPGTVRGITDDKQLFGPDGQIGGGHAGGANFGFADGGVRFLSDRISPEYLRRLATAAGGAGEIE